MKSNLLIITALYLLFALPLSIMDWKKFRISLPALLLGSIALISCRFVFPLMPVIPEIKNICFALVSSFLLYFSARVLTGEGLGFGDVFFGMYSAIFTGFYMNLIATVFAALLGVLHYLAMALIQRHKKKQVIHRPIFAIPFVPFITAGSLLSVVLFAFIACF